MSAANRIPVVTLLLVGANIAAAFAVVWQPELIARFGFKASHPEVVSALTSLFVHANTLHLLANMVFLSAVGPALEHGGGPLRLAAVYFLGGLAGVGAHWALAGESVASTPLVGASGAVVACVALVSVRHARLQVPLAPGFGAPVAAVAAVWLSLQVLGGFVRIGESGGGAAYWAHIGGFAAGLLLALVLRMPLEVSRSLGHESLDRLHQRSPGAAVAAAEAHLRHHPDDVKALRKLADAHAQLGDRAGEASALVRLLDVLPEMEQPEVLERLARIGELQRLRSLRRTLLAERFKNSHPQLAIELLESVLYGNDDDGQRPEALLALASLRRESDPEPARALVAELLDRYPLHPAAQLAKVRGLGE